MEPLSFFGWFHARFVRAHPNPHTPCSLNLCGQVFNKAMVKTVEEAMERAEKVGFPIMVKAGEGVYLEPNTCEDSQDTPYCGIESRCYRVFGRSRQGLWGRVYR